MTPTTPTVTDDRPPEEGDWQLVTGFMQLPRPQGVRIEDVPRERLLAALPALRPHERDLIERMYLRGQTLRQVAREVKVSTRAVWNTHVQAVMHLRAELRKQPPAG